MRISNRQFAHCRDNVTSIAALVAAGVVTTGAHAKIVQFVNPAQGEVGHFLWGPTAYSFNRSPLLDITRGAAEQRTWDDLGECPEFGNIVFQSRIDYNFDEIVDDGFAYTVGQHPGRGSASILTDAELWAAALVAGQPVAATAGMAWRDHGRYANLYPRLSNFPEGERRYIGVQTVSGNYGWIEVERDFLILIPCSWAYETEPGVPILAGQVPAPGAAALIGLCGLCAHRRRERNSRV